VFFKNCGLNYFASNVSINDTGRKEERQKGGRDGKDNW